MMMMSTTVMMMMMIITIAVVSCLQIPNSVSNNCIDDRTVKTIILRQLSLHTFDVSLPGATMAGGCQH